MALKEEIFQEYFLSIPRTAYSALEHKFNLSRTELRVILEELRTERHKDIQKADRLSQIFRNKRKENKELFKFVSFREFHDWYVETYDKQKGACFFCGATEGYISKIISKRSTRSLTRGKSLEVERLKSNLNENLYSLENCVLCCYVCNNAKSDIFTADEFRPIGEAIRLVWEHIK